MCVTEIKLEDLIVELSSDASEEVGILTRTYECLQFSNVWLPVVLIEGVPEYMLLGCLSCCGRRSSRRCSCWYACRR